jgi:hypothetical protein
MPDVIYVESISNGTITVTVTENKATLVITTGGISAEKPIVRAATAPATPYLLQLWVDTTANPYVMKCWNGSVWITVGGAGGGGGGHTIQDAGTSKTQRTKLNFVGFTVEDDSANDATKVTTIPTDISGKENTSNKGIASGYCDLDENIKIPIARIPDALIGQVKYQGTWNATTNTPALTNPDATAHGKYYIVSVAGTQFGIDFQIGDWCINNNGSWEKVDNTDAVQSVQGRTGAVVIGNSDVAAIVTGATADTPLDADEWTFRDAVDLVLKKISWANIKATLKTYFDGLYASKLLLTVNPIGNLGATPTIDFAGAYVQTATANVTITAMTLSNCPDNIGVNLILFETTGTTIAWDAAIRWSNGAAPSWAFTTGKATLYRFIKVGNVIMGAYSPYHATT